MDAVQDFLARHLAAEGCVVEPKDGGLHALLPAEVASALGLPEEAFLSTGASAEDGAGGAVDARLGSPIVEKAVAARRDSRPIATVALPGELPRPLPDHLPILINAVIAGPPGVRSRQAARYLVAHLRITLAGDELRSVIAPFTVRLDDGAIVPPLDTARGYPIAAAALGPDERRGAADGMGRAVRRHALDLLSGAIAAIGRRAQRDLGRVADYYTNLDTEMARAATRARTDDERARRLAKRAMLPAELAVRRAQVQERLAARVGAEMVAALVVETDVDRHEVPVRRRTKDGTVTLRRRAADGELEGPRCSGCGASVLKLYLCDQSLHALCGGCGQPGHIEPGQCRGCRPRPAPPFRLSVEDPTARLRLGDGNAP